MATLRDTGFFTGYDSTTLMVIGMNAAGGLLVAMVVKYADSILKVSGCLARVWTRRLAYFSDPLAS